MPNDSFSLLVEICPCSGNDTEAHIEIGFIIRINLNAAASILASMPLYLTIKENIIFLEVKL